jgi:hypothetical protein
MKKTNTFKAVMLGLVAFGTSITWSQTQTFTSNGSGQTGTLQTYTVPAGVTNISIEAWGSQGGSVGNFTGGQGAYIKGSFAVTAGEVFDILVGQQGVGTAGAAGGGGGTYVVLNAGNTPVLIAGGGSGATSNGPNGQPGLAGENGGDGQGSCGANAGTSGNGGGDSQSCGNGTGGGGGFITNGASASSYGSQFGYSYLNGGSGGISSYNNCVGGYGGGAGTHDNNTGGGPGGGYSGGGAPQHGNGYSGGGGGSYNTGTDQTNTADDNQGDGQVVITVLCNASANAFSVDVCDAYTVPSGDTTYMVSGVYNDTILNATGCDSVMTITVDVATLDLNTTTTDFTITADQATGSYQWINCSDNSPIAGETSQSFTADANGDYAVILSDGPCSDTSACATIAGVGINEVNVSNISIYPNPTNGEFYISSIANTVSVTVYSVDGKLVINNLKVNDSNQSINLGNVENGIYFVEITNDYKKETIRLIIE